MNSRINTNLLSSGEILIDFGLQPVSNRFLHPKSSTGVTRFPLKLRINKDNGLIHVDKPFPHNELKPRYEWITCFEPEDHLDDLVQEIIKLPNINKMSLFGAYSFKDDSTLLRLERLGYSNNWRIDPVVDLGILDPCANVETYQRELTVARAQAISDQRGAVDVLIVRHVIEHAHELSEFVSAIRQMIKPGGYIVWELPDCERALCSGDCTTIWEEHIYYFTQFTFKQILIEFGFKICCYTSFPYNLENSLIAIVQDTGVEACGKKPEWWLLAKELDRAQNFVKIFSHRKKALRKKLEKIRSIRGSIAIFGAGHLSVAFISLMQVEDLITCVIDDNPNKQGLQMPVGSLQIVGSEVLYSGRIGLCLLGLNPQNQPKVITKHNLFVKQGGLFASIFPGSEFDLDIIK